MKKTKKQIKKPNMFNKILSFILIVISVFTASVILYFEMLPLKYLIGLFIISSLIIFGISYKLNTKTNKFTKIVMSLLSFIIIIIEALGISFAFGTIDFLNNVYDTGYRTETYNIYVLKNSEYKNIPDLKGTNISIYESSSDSYKAALKKLSNKLEYDETIVESASLGVDAVLNELSSGFFISENLMNIYKETHEEDYAKLRVLSSIDILTKSKSDFKTVDVSKKPFVLYLSGSDLKGSINKVSRSDVNLLAVVNPLKGKVILINTPRDYYITLASKNALDKLTHAGNFGIEESALTLGLLYDVEVNYYARVNFTSFVKIIDAIGGIEVNSDYAFRYDGYSFKKGNNKLTGDAALAFSRGRKMLPEGDISRGHNQQAVIAGIINKVTNRSLLSKYNTILKSLESGLMTNVDKDAVSKLVNLQLKKNINWKIDNYSAKGTDTSLPVYSLGSNASVLKPDLDSITEIKLKIFELMN